MRIPIWIRGGLLAAGVMAGGMAYAAHDLLLQHTGPGEGFVTDTLTYKVRLDNSHPTHQDTATGITLTYVYDHTMFEFQGPPAFTNGGGSCEDNKPTVGSIECSIDDILYGTDNFELDISFYVHGGSFTGTSIALNPTATVASPGDAVGGNDSESVNTTVRPGTDLGVTLTSNPTELETLSSGSIWEHTVLVRNNGPLTTTGTEVTLVPPAAGMVWTEWPSNCALDGPDLVCSIDGDFAKTEGDDPIEENGPKVITGIKSQVVAAAGSTLIVNAGVSSNLTDNFSSNNQSNSSIAVTPGTDLQLVLTAQTGTILAGSPRTVTVTPTYHGGIPENPEFVITIPSTLQVDTSVPPSIVGWGTCEWTGNTVLTCDDWLTDGKVPGANQPMGAVSFPVTGPAGTHEITGAITSESQEPIPDPHSNSHTLDVVFSMPESNVTITKTGPVAPHNIFTVGASVSYTVTLRATGNVDYWEALSWSESAPPGLKIDNIVSVWPVEDIDLWNCDTSGCNRTYAPEAPLASGTEVRFTVNATVESADGSTNLVNRACRAEFNHPLGVTQPEVCANAGPITGNPGSGNTDLSVVKTIDGSDNTFKAGEWLKYQIELINAGSAAATSAKVTDTLADLWLVPTNEIGALGGSLQITSLPSGWTCTASGTPLAVNEYFNGTTANLECVANELAVCIAGADCPTVRFQVRPLGNNSNGGARARSNTAVISSATQELDFTNNTHSVESHPAILAKTDFTIAKTVSNDNDWNSTEGGITGTELQYTITVSNSGARSGANNVIVTDVLPENVTYLGISSVSGDTSPVCTGLALNEVTSSDSNTLTCRWNTFPRTAVRSFIVSVRPNHNWQGLELVNDVYVNIDPDTQVALASTTEETDYTNNHAQATAKAGEAQIDLQVNKRDTVDPVYVGSNTEYEVVITNNGPSVATDATIYDYLPVKGFSWVGNVRFFKTDNGQNRGEEITAGAVCTKVPELEAFGAGGEDKELPGKLSWLWPMNAQTADPDDPGYNADYVNGKWDSRINSKADIICNVGDMMPDDKVMLVYTMKAEERGVYLNHAIVRAEEHRARVDEGFTDSVWNNDAIQHRTTVRSVPDATLTKEVSHSPVNLMEPFTYTITVTNNSSVEQLYAPHVRDVLPVGMELTGTPVLTSGAQAGFACYDLPTVGANEAPELVTASQAGDTAFVCDLGEAVAAQGSVVITVPVRVTEGGAATHTNTARLHLDTDLEFDGPAGWDPEKPWEPNPVLENDEPVTVVVSSISGYVYHDENDNGVKDAGEAPISGVTVTLTGVDDYGNNVSPKQVTTNSEGYYRFPDLAPGRYTVTETHPSGWIDGQDNEVGQFDQGGASTPGSGTVGNDVFNDIQLPGNTDGTDYNFGELKPFNDPSALPASISGFVYHDASDDGIKDTDEEPIANVIIRLQGENGDVRETTTDANGYYRFDNLEPGVVYTVTEEQPSGWNDGKDNGAGTEHQLGSIDNDQFTFTPVADSHGENWNFGELKPVPAPVPVPVNNPLALLALFLGMGWVARRYYMRKQS